MMVLVLNVFKNQTPGRVDKVFRRGQLLSAAAYSLGHGTNDAQKTMGIIAVLLFTTGHLGPSSTCRSGSSWRLTPRSAGHDGGRLAHREDHGHADHQAAARRRLLRRDGGCLTLLGTAIAGIPVSTTQTISGSIMGVGAIQRFSAVRWGVAGRILWAWILTIPASAIVAGVTWGLLRLFTA
jgi:PiT family inorganic phosphate transporter